MYVLFEALTIFWLMTLQILISNDKTSLMLQLKKFWDYIRIRLGANEELIHFKFPTRVMKHWKPELCCICKSHMGLWILLVWFKIKGFRTLVKSIKERRVTPVTSIIKSIFHLYLLFEFWIKIEYFKILMTKVLEFFFISKLCNKIFKMWFLLEIWKSPRKKCGVDPEVFHPSWLKW